MRILTGGRACAACLRACLPEAACLPEPLRPSLMQPPGYRVLCLQGQDGIAAEHGRPVTGVCTPAVRQLGPAHNAGHHALQGDAAGRLEGCEHASRTRAVALVSPPPLSHWSRSKRWRCASAPSCFVQEGPSIRCYLQAAGHFKAGHPPCRPLLWSSHSVQVQEGCSLHSAAACLSPA